MDEKYMNIALQESLKSLKKNEVPVGCVIVKEGKIVAKAYNLKEKKSSALAHAELIAIAKANKKLKNWRLSGCEIYITMEPCPMCASAIKQSRIARVYYGVENENNKISKKIFQGIENNNSVEVIGGFREKDCKEIVQKFFRNKRNDKNL